MTVRTAELLMAIATILVSLGLMWKSLELQIGWVPNRGPGSGFWPFWLATGMLLAAITTLVRWFLRITPESRSSEVYISRSALAIVGISVLAIAGLLIGTMLLGIYVALFFFLFFYIKLVGRHDWPLTVMLVGGIPVFIFALFEWGLQIPLPKAASEEWFYPVYDVMYSDQTFWAYLVGIYVVLAALAFGIHAMGRTARG